MASNASKSSVEINRNKSCIWIPFIRQWGLVPIRLIETRVVFEFCRHFFYFLFKFWLIETRVVFELASQSINAVSVGD